MENFIADITKEIFNTLKIGRRKTAREFNLT